ncbi:MAG: dCTP deaminase [Candidatus Schekmanbacteria bacterium]|nr:dCTP deaminase [Candidatus Schekmanbacteria bacterium]
MSVKSDNWLVKMAKEKGMIEPFEASQIKKGNISYGVSSYGYDLRLFDEYRVPQGNRETATIDPKNLDISVYKNVKAPVLEIEPGQTVLGRSLEYFRIPRDIIVLCFGKSTYARCGLLVNITPLEPEWEGFITIAISNISSSKVRAYSMEGISQAVFIESDETCAVSYADKGGKYQAQKAITYAKI